LNLLAEQGLRQQQKLRSGASIGVRFVDEKLFGDDVMPMKFNFVNDIGYSKDDSDEFKE